MSTHQSSKRSADERVTVFGCGLIGGSIALALRSARPRSVITGIDRPAVLERARARGAIDRGMSRRAALSSIAEDAPSIVVLAMPVDAIAGILAPLARACRDLPPKRRPLVIDVGSVKGEIVSEARRVGLPRFVGGHPMAGQERGGIEHARSDLLAGAHFVLCPRSARSPDLTAAKRFVARLGARPLVVDAATHDRAVALTSHLPHLAAWALLDASRELGARLGDVGLVWKLAAGSWSDSTRVAASDPRLWSPIVGQNREGVLEALALLIDRLHRLRSVLDAGGDPLCVEDDGLPVAELARLARRRAVSRP